MAKRSFKFNKLVRDKIPELIQSQNCTLHAKILGKKALLDALKNKLVEEAQEVAQTNSIDDLKEEMADILEVVHKIMSEQNLDFKEIEKIRSNKNSQRGGFEQNTFISFIEIDESNPAIKYYAERSMQYPEIPSHTPEFWQYIEKLVTESEIVIDRPKNTAHPKYGNFIYPVDYGFLKGTKASDNNEIDIWVGSAKNNKINGILCTVDPVKKDTETKIIYSCTKQEISLIYDKMNEVLRAIYIPKP